MDLDLVPQPSDQFFLVVVVVVKCLGLFFPRMALVGELGHLQCQVVHLLLLLVGMGVVGVVVLQQRGQFILDMLVVARQLLVLGHHFLYTPCQRRRRRLTRVQLIQQFVAGLAADG